MLSSTTLQVATTSMAALAGSGGLWLTVREVIRYRSRREVERIRAEAEAARYQWAERMTADHGPGVLPALPNLAKALREDAAKIRADRRSASKSKDLT